jgi:ABC-type transport system substrate-binding protein
MLMARNRGPGVEPGTQDYSDPIGSLAESWEVAADGSKATFTLRRDDKFHNIPPVNGRVMDIDDWKTSHERSLATGAYRAEFDSVVAKAEYPDRMHMVWTFRKPYAPIFDRIAEGSFAYYILPKELNANPSIAEITPIGTNYQIFDKYQPSITFEFRNTPGIGAAIPSLIAGTGPSSQSTLTAMPSSPAATSWTSSLRRGTSSASPKTRRRLSSSPMS